MNKATLKRFEQLLSVISSDFDRRILEDPDFASDMPSNAYVLFQLKMEGPVTAKVTSEVEAFNTWLKDLAERQRDAGQPVYVATLHVTYKPIPRTPPLLVLERFPREFELAHQ